MKGRVCTLHPVLQSTHTLHLGVTPCNGVVTRCGSPPLPHPPSDAIGMPCNLTIFTIKRGRGLADLV